MSLEPSSSRSLHLDELPLAPVRHVIEDTNGGEQAHCVDRDRTTIEAGDRERELLRREAAPTVIEPRLKEAPTKPPPRPAGMKSESDREACAVRPLVLEEADQALAAVNRDVLVGSCNRVEQLCQVVGIGREVVKRVFVGVLPGRD